MRACFTAAGVLECLQTVQSLDRLDIENIAPFWAAMSMHLCNPMASPNGSTNTVTGDRPNLSHDEPAKMDPPAGSPPAAEQHEAESDDAELGLPGLTRVSEDPRGVHVAIKDLQHAMDQTEQGAQHPTDLQAKLLQLPRHQGLLIIQAYLLAAMAKDCSIMLSIALHQGTADVVESARIPQSCGYTKEGTILQQLVAGLHEQVFAGTAKHEATGTTLSYRLALIDTEPKPALKIAAHSQLDKEIVAANS